MKNDRTDNRYDFGEDADVVPPADPAFDAWVANAAPGLNAPGSVPRREMWEAIQAARGTAGVIPRHRGPWRLMALMAAALLVGVAIDRMVLRKSDETTPVAVAPVAADSSEPSRLYRMAAAQTLTQAEALLTAYRASANRERDPGTAPPPQLGRWGRDILSSTRLLMDSPAGDDPQLRALLGDLELVLVQIIQISGAELGPSERALMDRARERALIDHAIEERDLLPRIRTVVPVGAIGAADAKSEE